MLKIICYSTLALVLLAQTSCSKKGGESTAGAPRPARTSQAIKADVPVYLDAIGILTASSSVDIKSQVTGKITEALFTEGQFVKKGDLLFEVDSAIYVATINEAKSVLRQNVADAKIAGWLVDKDKKIAQTGAMSTQDYANILASFEKASGRVQSAQAVIDRNNIALDYCTIESPIDGITGVRQIDPGNVIIADSGPVLVNVKAIDPLYVDFTVPERNYTLLRDSINKGALSVIVATDSLLPGGQTEIRKFYGTLQFLDNTVNPSTGTISLRASIPNKDKGIWPGQFVRVRMTCYIQKDALLVPVQSVNMGLKGNYVYAVKDSKAVLCWVQRGLVQGDYVTIDGFIGDNKFVPGDTVVTVGQGGITPNSTIFETGKDTFTLPSAGQETDTPEKK